MRRLALVLGLVTAIPLGATGCSGSEGAASTVEVRLAEDGLRLAFDPACPVAFLRLSAGGTALWEIRAEPGAGPLGPVVAGTPPTGYTEMTDDVRASLPATVELSVKNEGWFGATIGMAALRGGDTSRLTLRPVMNELSPSGALC